MNSDTDSQNSKSDSSSNTDSQRWDLEVGHKPPHALELKVPPVLVFFIFASVFWSIDTWFPVFDVDIPFRSALVLFLTGTALLVGAWSIWLFRRNDTTVHAHKPHETERLVTSGPYKHSRNPMYLALSMVLIAVAIYLTDLLSMMLIPGFFVYMTRFQIIPEERRMLQIFGDEYQEYAENTPRWL